jgi:hypothetical protein
MELLGDVGQVEARSIHLETVLISTHDSRTVHIERAIGLEIIMAAPVGTPR